MDDVDMSQKSEGQIERRVAKVQIAIPLLEHLLPFGTTIRGFKFNDCYNTVEVIVSHPSFPELNEGDMIPSRMLMVYKESHEGHSRISKIEYGHQESY